MLASGSAARAYAAIGGRLPVVSIGAETSRVARAAGLTVVAEAATHDVDGLVAAVRDLMDSRRMSVITFLTDFGLEDDFVGTCHGVIARIAPDARVIDVTHGIAPQAVLSGALVLRARRRSCRSACTSPSSTRTSAATGARSRCDTTDGRVFVGPDNGLLMLAADAARDRRPRTS